MNELVGSIFLLLRLTASSLFVLGIGAQCDLRWQPMLSFPGTNARVLDLLPEVPGGLTGGLFACGEFRIAGDQRAAYIVKFDGVGWQPLGVGLDGPGHVLARLPGGDLVVGGSFAMAGGGPAANIARWDGASWAPLGNGLPGGVVHALLVLADGSVLAGGDIPGFGGLARWDGGSWATYQGTDGVVRALEGMPNGDVAIGGQFSTIGGTPASSLAIYDGSGGWQLPATATTADVYALAAAPNGDLYVGGRLLVPFGSPFARWNGAAITSVGPYSFTPPEVRSLHFSSAGELLIAGARYASVGPVVVKLNLANGWTTLATGRDPVFAAMEFAGEVVAAGGAEGITEAPTIRTLSPAGWRPLFGAELPTHIYTALEDGAGGLFVGGIFTSIGGVPAENIAHFDGQNWQALPGGGTSGRVNSLAMLSNGDLLVSGQFQMAGGVPANRIARWDGSAWSEFGGGQPYPAGLVVLPDERIVALRTLAPQFQIYDGGQWQVVAPPNSVGAPPRDLVALPNGELVLVGYVGGRAWRWDGVSWSAMGSGVPADHVELGPDGTLYISDTSGIFEWSGSSWQLVVAVPRLTSLSVMPDGDLVAGLQHAISEPLVGLARWDGVTWERIDGSMTGGGTLAGALPFTRAGQLFALGDFDELGLRPSPKIGLAVSTCPATVVSVGAGCPSSGGGVMRLVAENRAWLGTKFESFADGFAANSLAVHAIGSASAALPLPGSPGCTVDLVPDASEVLVPTAGRVEIALEVPDSVALLGATVRTQVFGVEFDASFQLLGVTTSNALEFTIGDF